ncbi:MAG: DUF4174 domain-containing protein [Bacteroidota bacterium]
MVSQAARPLTNSGTMISSLSLSLLLGLLSITVSPLQSYKWKNRILIVYAKNKNLLSKQLTVFVGEKTEFKERDLVIFKLNKYNGINPSGQKLTDKDYQWLVRRYFSTSDKFGIVLIGKDGGVKLKSKEQIGNKRLFDLIDSMPMRMQEMKEGQ